MTKKSNVPLFYAVEPLHTLYTAFPTQLEDCTQWHTNPFSLALVLHCKDFPKHPSLLPFRWTFRGCLILCHGLESHSSSPCAEDCVSGWEQDCWEEGTCSFYLGLYCQKTLQRDLQAYPPHPQLDQAPTPLPAQ